jgi:hypothetical protein
MIRSVPMGRKKLKKNTMSVATSNVGYGPNQRIRVKRIQENGDRR